MRDGLTDLRTEKAISAGFSSLASVVPSLTSGLAAGGESLGGPRVLGRLPHRGETPVLYRLLLDANGPKMTVSAVVPQAVVEDVVALSVSQMPRLVRPSTGF